MASDLDLFFQFFSSNPILDSMLPCAKMFVASNFSYTCDLHGRCIGMCLELNYFATSYSSVDFCLQNQSYMLQAVPIKSVENTVLVLLSKAILVS